MYLCMYTILKQNAAVPCSAAKLVCVSKQQPIFLKIQEPWEKINFLMLY